MNVGETLDAPSREEWRKWLVEHHGLEAEVWLVFHKKSSGRPSLGYDEAVEEAVCFGWIDGRVKSLDGERYARRFTPRRPGGSWSPYNKRRALKMLRAGKMTPAGERFLPPDVLAAWGGE